MRAPEETLSLGVGCRAATLVHRHRAIERAITAMRQHLAEPLSHRALARVALLSPHHFNRVFREVTGLPPLRFLYALRIQAAKRLLMTTRRSITDVCYDVGYNSLGTFISRFTRLVGQSPKRLRRLSDDPPRPALDLLCRSAARPPAALDGLGVRGRIEAPDSLAGPVVVGLFSEPIPRGRPAGCAVLPVGGEYHIAPVPDGVYYACAIALPRPPTPLHDLFMETAPRGRSGPVAVRDGRSAAPAGITLRPARPTDPPMLLSLPLVAEKLAAADRPTGGPQTRVPGPPNGANHP
jgi:AraC-like DNA-binding protein